VELWAHKERVVQKAGRAGAGPRRGILWRGMPVPHPAPEGDDQNSPLHCWGWGRQVEVRCGSGSGLDEWREARRGGSDFPAARPCQ